MRRLRDLLILGLSPRWVRLEVIPMIGLIGLLEFRTPLLSLEIKAP